MVSELKEPTQNILEQLIVFKLDFIRQIIELNSEFIVEEESDILSTIKQFADYDISAQTLRKIKGTYSKKFIL